METHLRGAEPILQDIARTHSALACLRAELHRCQYPTGAETAILRTAVDRLWREITDLDNDLAARGLFPASALQDV